MEMRDFVKSFVLPLLAKRLGGTVCEIGASRGESTDVLAALPNVMITVIDPCLDCNLSQKYADNPHVKVKKGISLVILPELRDVFDCILIDGDHNWYTVYQESKLIFERNLLKLGGMVFFHDVEWPWGRRDMYYQPEMIPPEHRHNWEQKGIIPGKGELTDQGGFYPWFRKATHEGGPRNGVLTAIEDFWFEHKREWLFFRVRRGVGLGILYRRGTFSDDLGFLSFKCKGTVYNVLAWLIRFTKIHFPTVFLMAKSLLSKNTI